MQPSRPVGPNQDIRLRPGSSLSALGDHWQGVVRRLASARNRWAYPVLISGFEKHSQEPLTVLYFGSGSNLEYLIGLAFATESEREEYASTKSWRSRISVENQGQDVDLVFLDLPWPYHRLVPRDRYLESPSWLQQRVVLSDSWEGVVRSFRRNTRSGQLRKIRRYELDYRVTRQRDAAKSFYDDFYRPHLASRFGEAATYMSRSYVESCILRGGLLQVISGDQLLGAVVLHPWGNRLQLVFAGLARDIRDRRSRYVFAALYYFSIKFGFEQGFRDLDLTGSRPLLSDGVLRFKRQWGASLHDPWVWGLDTLLIRPNNFGHAVREFLRGNPWIVREKEGLVGKVLTDDRRAMADQLEHLVRQFECKGLRAIKVFSLCGFSDDAQERVVAISTPIHLINLEAVENPADLFCRS